MKNQRRLTSAQHSAENEENQQRYGGNNYWILERGNTTRFSTVGNG